MYAKSVSWRCFRNVAWSSITLKNNLRFCSNEVMTTSIMRKFEKKSRGILLIQVLQYKALWKSAGILSLARWMPHVAIHIITMCTAWLNALLHMLEWEQLMIFTIRILMLSVIATGDVVRSSVHTCARALLIEIQVVIKFSGLVPNRCIAIY